MQCMNIYNYSFQNGGYKTEPSTIIDQHGADTNLLERSLPLIHPFHKPSTYGYWFWEYDHGS